MHNVKDTELNIRSYKDFKDMVEAYEEIAARRMRKVKDTVLKDREFFKGLSDVFRFVRHSYEVYLQKIRALKSKNLYKKTNGKKVVVLLSSNIGLYGDIVFRTFKKFTDELKNYKNADIVIIGRVGKRLFEEAKIDFEFKFFEFSDSGTDDIRLKSIIEHLLPYEEIILYHGEFENILSQKPVKTIVTGELESFFESKGTESQEETGIFEPSIEEVAAFFEKESLSIIIEQSVNESSLSKFASRMINLDLAIANINKKVRDTSFLLKKLKHRDLNKKQLSVVSSISLWNKQNG